MPSERTASRPSRAAIRLSWLAVGAVMAFFAWATYAHVVVLLVADGDAWGHLALIRHTLDHGWFAGDAFYAGAATPPFYSLAHILLAAVSALTARPPHQVWLAAPPVLAVLTIAATLAWLRALAGDLRIAVVGAAVELLVQTPDPTWWVMPYPRTLALTPFAFALLSYLRARQTARLSWTIAAGIALGICISLHLVVGGICLLALCCLELALARPICRPSPRVLPVALIGLLVGLPWLLTFVQRWREREGVGTENFGVPPEAWLVWRPSLMVMIHRPGAILDALPWPLWLPAGLGVLVCVRRWRAGRAGVVERYALLSSFAALLLLLTPLYGVLLAVAGVWSARLVRLIPWALLVGVGSVGAADSLHAAALPQRLRHALPLAALVLAVCLAALAARTVSGRVAQWAGASNYLRIGGPLGRWDLAAELGRTGPLPRVVLSDPDTSYLLAYYLGSAVVTMPPGHGSAYVNHRPRTEAAAHALRLRTPLKQVHDILDAYGVDTVAINPASNWPAAGTAAVLQRLRRDPAFVDTGCCGDLVFLHYVPQEAE